LRMVHHFGVDNVAGSLSTKNPEKGVSRKQVKTATFQQIKLAGAITEGIEYIESNGHANADGDLWKVLKAQAGEILRGSGSTVRRPVASKGIQS